MTAALAPLDEFPTLSEFPSLDEGVVVTFSPTGPTTITVPAVGNYTIQCVGDHKVVYAEPSARPRVGDARPVTPELIEAAADLMDRVGMHKGDLWPGARAEIGGDRVEYRQGQPVCAWGAVLVSAGVSSMPAAVSVDEYIWDEHSVLHNVAVFNDDPVRTKGEVVEQLRHRARMLRQLQAA